MGPMTGRGAGVCSGYAQAGNYRQGRGAGRGMGCGMGMGRGMGRGRGVGGGWGGAYAAPQFAAPTAEEQVEILKNQAAQLQQMLEGVNSRIAGLEAAPANK